MMWFALLLTLGLATAQEICLSVQDYPYLMFGTKTAYLFANRDPRTKVHEVPGCQPTALFLLNRYGPHNPERPEIRELERLEDLRNNILANYNNGSFRDTNQRICRSDLDLLYRWKWRVDTQFAGDLTTAGYMTTQQQAQAWKQKFPGLLTTNHHNYLFKYVNEKSSSNSFKAFTEGIFGDQAESLDIPKDNDENSLRPYESCPAWTKDVEENNGTVPQLSIFESKQEYKEMISNISLRLGFNYDMQKEIILNIYQMCRYNKAWDVTKISPWCAVFTREDLKRLEYAEDLETYYKYGYGSDINKNIGCAMVKDMMNFLNKHVNDAETPQQPRVLIHFNSAPMLLLTLTAMGAHKDIVPLTGDNYPSANVQVRKWTTSTMMPFNANLAAVLYKCTLNGKFQIREPYQVLFLENERPMDFEGCRVGLCDWSLVRHRYEELANNCDLKLCNGAAMFSGLTAIGITLTVFVVRFI